MPFDFIFNDSVRYYFLILNFLEINLYLAIDGFSLIFLFLTAILVPVCTLVGWESIKNDNLLYNSLIFLSVFFLNIIFIAVDFLTFFIFFELLMIPIFLIIGKWGSRAESLKASFYFWFYTLFGSFFILVALIFIKLYIGSFFFINFINIFQSNEILSIFIFIFLLIGLMVKIPVGPFFHLWLPQAHVEAPTSGSVLLAGIILKIGAYGIIRFLIPVFSYFFIKYSVFFCFFSILSVISVLWNIEACTDLKKMIAYMSISHMNLALMSLICNVDNFLGLQSFIFFMFSHGIISIGLFSSIGFIYERTGTRDLLKIFSLKNQPIFSNFFIFFLLANLAFPPFSSFICEILVYISLGIHSLFILLLSMIGFFFNGYLSILIFCKLLLNEGNTNYLPFYDLTQREITISIFLLIIIIFLGIHPNFLLDLVELDVQNSLYEARYHYTIHYYK